VSQAADALDRRQSPGRAEEFRRLLQVVTPAHSSGAASADVSSSGTATSPGYPPIGLTFRCLLKVGRVRRRIDSSPCHPLGFGTSGAVLSNPALTEEGSSN
jgi:hypothetical protein